MKPFKTFDPKEHVDRAVIALHGYTGDRNSLYPVAVGTRSKNARWYFPEAPYPLEKHDGNSWFIKDENGYWNTELAFEILDDLLTYVRSDGIPPERTIILGFSQGACLTLEFGLRYKKQLGGLIPIAGFISYPEQLNHDLKEQTITPPVLIMHGTRDTIVPPEKGEEILAFLEERHYPVRIVRFNAGHKIQVSAMNEIRTFISEV